MDQSSGHGRMREGALNANNMSVRYGGCQEKLRDTKIRDVGTYPRTLEIGDVQSMVFLVDDDGPFYLSAAEKCRYKFDRLTGKSKMREKSKKRLIEELKIQKKICVRRYYKRDEINEIATVNGIRLTYEEPEIVKGWVGRPKGMLQVLWERGWIDCSKLEEYSANGKKNKKDESGKVRPEFQQYVLRTLMKSCLDFSEEQSAMEVLLSELSRRGELDVQLLTSPKYHCELAGEGVEYCWGLSKRFYRSLSLEKKRTKAAFDKCVREAITFVKKEHVERFSGKCRRYMMAYNAYDQKKDPLTYKAIERFVKMAKTHRNIADQDKAFVEKAWRQAILDYDEN